MPALQERTQDVPRIAVSCLWLGVIVAAVGLNMARYPGVSRMVGEVCQPQPLAPSASAAPSAAALPPTPSSLKAESKPPAPPERPAIAAQPVEAKNPPPWTPNRSESRTADLARAASPAPVVPAAVALESPPPADPLDLGNGVRRLPPVE